MDAIGGIRSGRRHAAALLILLALAALTRLYHLHAPLIEQLYPKQVYIANKARSLARNPLQPVKISLDFLDAGGQRMVLVEEVPVYTGLIAAGYRLVGEHEWVGRLWSLLASLLAIAALYDLLKREFDEGMGLAAAFLFAFSPLLTFYGRAVLPDPCMLACMLICVACYRRHLDGEGPAAWRWLVGAGAAGLLAGMFKYFGLLVLIPLADMAYRRDGWRGWRSARFLGLVAALTLPMAAWIVGVFARYPNPTASTSYFVFQEWWTITHPRLYERLTLGFLVKDFGPVAAFFLVIGVMGACRGAASRPLWGWTAAGLLFAVLTAPKMLDHDYYGLVLLPAAAGWGAVGWRTSERFLGQRRGLSLGLAAAAVVVVHSPFVMRSKYEQETGQTVVAGRLQQLCPAEGKFVVMGQRFSWPVVHYSGREGWVEQLPGLPRDWRERFARYREMGARLVAVYFDPTVPAAARATYRPALEGLPVVEHRAGPWFRAGRPVEYYILRLDAEEAGQGRIAAGRSEERYSQVR
jgi:4-amino-4-deoxy-L-arabinose transferase-like glycosyltransferase